MTLSSRPLVAAFFALVLAAVDARTAETPAGRTPLPQAHPYQVADRSAGQ